MKKIEVVAYDSSWPKSYELVAKKIKDALGNKCVAIYHVGSTAVPGLASKNKIDICLQVSDAESAILNLEEIGFKHSGEWNIPFKYGLTYRKNKEIKVNLHMFDFDHPAIESNLLFRDYLRKHELIREKYAQLKYEILEDESAQNKSHPFLYNYTLCKGEFVREVIKLTGFNKAYMQFCSTEAEKDFANGCHLAKGLPQINDEMFFNTQHKHFILYKGVDMLCYAHVQLQGSNQAVIKVIDVIESSYREQFLALLRKWFVRSGLKIDIL